MKQSSLKCPYILLIAYEFFAPLIAILFAMLAGGFYLTYVSVHFSRITSDESIIGYIQAAYFLGLLLGAWKIESAIRKFGHIQVLTASGALLASMILIQSLTDNFFIWGITRSIAGISMASFYVVIECWLLSAGDAKKRGKALLLYMIMLNMGVILGQKLFHYLDFNSQEPFIIPAILLALSVVPVSLTTKELPRPSSLEKFKAKELFIKAPFGMAVCFASGVGISALYAFFALTSDFGPQAVEYGVLGGMLSQPFFDKLACRFDRRKVLLGQCLLSVVICCLFAYYVNDVGTSWASLALVMLLGVSIYTLYPIALTHTTDHFDRIHLAAMTAIILVVYGVGSCVGPVGSAYCIEWIGRSGLFIFLGVFMACVCAMGFYALIKKKPISNQERGEEIIIPTISHIEPGQ